MSRPQPQNFNHLKALAQKKTAPRPERQRVTVIIPTTHNSPTLATAIKSIQAQTAQTETIIIDTGSEIPDYERLEARYADHPRIHVYRIAPRHWQHLSEPVAAALDLGISQANTEWIFLTHDDVFLKNENLLNEMIKTATTTQNDFVGYEMSPRSHITEQWRGMLSHTCTLLFTAALRQLNARWSLTDAFDNAECVPAGEGWPDTETAFGLTLKQAGIKPHFIGHETNDLHHEDANFVHRRSLTTHRKHWPALASQDTNWVDQQIKIQQDRLNDNIDLRPSDGVQADPIDLLPTTATTAAPL